METNTTSSSLRHPTLLPPNRRRTRRKGAKNGLLVRGGDVLERLAKIDVVALDKTGTLTEGKPTVTVVASFTYEEAEVLQLAAAVEKTASHPIAKAILSKAEEIGLRLLGTRGQLTEPGFGSLAEVDGSLVAVGKRDWVHDRFQRKSAESELVDLENRITCLSSDRILSSNQSHSVVYVGREGEGIIGAIAISDILRPDAKSTVHRLQEKGIKTVLLSGDREEAVVNVGKIVGIGNESINASLTPQQKSSIISSLQAEGHHVAMIGDGINDAPSLALADVGVALQIDAKENAASDAALVILLGNRLSQIVDALTLAQATMTKVHQNLAWAIAYNIVAIPIVAGILLPQFDFAMTPSLSGGLMAMSSIFVTNSLLLKLHNSSTQKEDVALASVSMRSIPFAPVLEKLSLTEENYGSIRRFFIETTEDNAIPLSLQESMSTSNPPEKVFRLRGSDHSPFFSKPQALHKLLVEIAKLPPPSQREQTASNLEHLDEIVIRLYMLIICQYGTLRLTF